MKAYIWGDTAFVWMPTIDYEKGVYEYYIFPTLLYTNNKEKKYKSLTLHWWNWAIISAIKTV